MDKCGTLKDLQKLGTHKAWIGQAKQKKLPPFWCPISNWLAGLSPTKMRKLSFIGIPEEVNRSSESWSISSILSSVYRICWLFDGQRASIYKYGFSTTLWIFTFFLYFKKYSSFVRYTALSYNGETIIKMWLWPAREEPSCHIFNFRLLSIDFNFDSRNQCWLQGFWT